MESIEIMSNNVGNIVIDVMSILKNKISVENLHRIHYKYNNRSIYLSESSFNFIRDAVINTSNSFINSKIGLVSVNDSIYVVGQGESVISSFYDFTNELIGEEENIKSLLGLIAAQYGIIKILEGISEFYIIDNFLGFDDNSKVFQLDEILDVFEKYYVYKINNNVFALKYKEDIDRLNLLLLLVSKRSIMSELSCDAVFMNNLRDLLLLKSSNCILNNLVSCVEQNNIYFKFLHLYHCIEFLFIIHEAMKLNNKYELDMTVALKIISNEGYGTRESSYVTELLAKYCDSIAIQNYFDYLESNNLKHLKLGFEDNKAGKVAEYIYETRCKIAHYKFNQGSIENEEIFKIGCMCMGRVVYSIYDKIDKRLIDIYTGKGDTKWNLIKID